MTSELARGLYGRKGLLELLIEMYGTRGAVRRGEEPTRRADEGRSVPVPPRPRHGVVDGERRDGGFVATPDRPEPESRRERRSPRDEPATILCGWKTRRVGGPEGLRDAGTRRGFESSLRRCYGQLTATILATELSGPPRPGVDLVVVDGEVFRIEEVRTLSLHGRPAAWQAICASS